MAETYTEVSTSPQRTEGFRPFGRVLTAMVTPFLPDRSLDVDGAARLATYLVDNGCDGVVVNGTTGESPTTSDAEKEYVIRSVVEAVGDRARVIAGVGTPDTAHSVELARQAEKAGAHGLLAVTPYYNKPPQSGLIAHFAAIADATELGVMLYDIPGRTGCAITTDTLVRLAEHPRILANKDAKGDLGGASWVMARSDLAYYSGEDILTLPLLAVGAVGVVSVTGHLCSGRIDMMIACFDAGDVRAAQRLHQDMLPVCEGIFRTQGVITVKAALAQLGLPGGPVRPPLVDATEFELAQLVLDLADGGVPGFTA